MGKPRAKAALSVSIENLLEGVQVIGFDWTYRYLNKTAATQGERSVEDLSGKTMMEAYPGIESTPLFANLKSVMERRVAARMVNGFSLPSGDRRWFELLIEPVPGGIVILSMDVTERLSAERQLHQALKMETLGQLAGGVAHDFNNMLTAIMGYAALITEEIAPDTSVARDLDEIVVAAHRAAAMTRQLLAFSRQNAPLLSPVLLNVAIQEVEPTLRRLLPENVRVRIVPGSDIRPVLADRTELEQTIFNLAINARDAMPDGGVITIETSNATLDQDYVERHPGLAAGEFAMLSISDTGIGMSPEVKARIFEPFYTTKEAGRGTGLGLAAVQRMVAQLHGHVFVYSEPGEGSVFKIYLPETDLPLAPPVPSQPHTGPAGNETILVVEDDSSVREFLQRVLERHGYTVISAASGEAALAMLTGFSEPVHLLLTDLMLPGINGVDLAVRLTTRDSGLRTLFMSGYAETRIAPIPSDAPVMSKPFIAQELLVAVRKALDC